MDGIKYQPIISMAGKILAFIEEEVWKVEDIHHTFDGTIAKIKSGLFLFVFYKHETDD